MFASHTILNSSFLKLTPGSIKGTYLSRDNLVSENVLTDLLQESNSVEIAADNVLHYFINCY